MTSTRCSTPRTCHSYHYNSSSFCRSRPDPVDEWIKENPVEAASLLIPYGAGLKLTSKAAGPAVRLSGRLFGRGNTASSGMAGVRATGAAGEAAAGIVKNTTRIPSASGTAKYRIPDELTDTVLGEVKNVSHLNYTSQLRDFAAFANQKGLTFTLYTRGATTFSSTLQAEIDAGRIVLNTTRLGP